jgi:pyruvate formate lyase activating enzyme
MHEARLWEQAGEGRVHCRRCSHFCRIGDGERGQCGVRENHGGRLFTLVYDRVAAANLDPVEKKPLYHFLPGTMTFSFGTPGCNFACSFCQNASLSQPPRSGAHIAGHPATPDSLLAAALECRAQSISYTYSEPTIFFELVQDTAALARSRGLKNILVSNGFMSRFCLEELDGLIDAANIDLKAFSEDFYRNQCAARLAPVLENLKRIKAMGWWLEVTTLVIPGCNDSDRELADIAGFIAAELGPDTPWHVSRFHPQHKMQDRPPTPMDRLAAAARAGDKAGLRYVYVGNVPGNNHGHTRCPSCHKIVMRRRGFEVRVEALEKGRCRHCGAAIAGVGLP